MKKLFFIIVLAALVSGGYFIYSQKQAAQPQTPPSDWITYKNEKYNFEIMHPKEWEVFVSDTDLDPKINIYKKSETAKPPFIHHNDVANVSIFPSGVATEGVLGTTTHSNVTFSVSTNQAIDYVLQNSDRWATLATFKDAPKSWKEYGFIWSRAHIENHIQTCTLNGAIVAVDRCHALGEPGAILTDTGTVDKNERMIETQMLASFRFVQE